MRACLLVCAALALAPGPWARAAATTHEPARLQHIKTQILAKLGLSSRPTPLGTPPRDVVRQILARAADPYPEPPQVEHSMREIIAIAHRGIHTRIVGLINRSSILLIAGEEVSMYPLPIT